MSAPQPPREYRVWAVVGPDGSVVADSDFRDEAAKAKGYRAVYGRFVVDADAPGAAGT
jgi:hypothetical protein